MKGTMLTYLPKQLEPSVQEYTEAPSLTDIQTALGGYLESIPYFQWIDYDGRHHCVAYCNEYGKLKNMEINHMATALWYQPPNGGSKLRDVLVGPVVVLFGDKEFMENQ